MCDHTNFDARVEVDRMVNEDEEGKVLGTVFKARVYLKCTECNTDFIFDPHDVDVNSEGHELMIAVEPPIK